MSLLFLFKRISTLKCPEQATGELVHRLVTLNFSWQPKQFKDLMWRQGDFLYYLLGPIHIHGL